LQLLRSTQRAQELDSEKPQICGAEKGASAQFIQRRLRQLAVITDKVFIELPEDSANGTRLIDAAVGFDCPNVGQRIDISSNLLHPSPRDIDSDH